MHGAWISRLNCECCVESSSSSSSEELIDCEFCDTELPDTIDVTITGFTLCVTTGTCYGCEINGQTEGYEFTSIPDINGTYTLTNVGGEQPCLYRLDSGLVMEWTQFDESDCSDGDGGQSGQSGEIEMAIERVDGGWVFIAAINNAQFTWIAESALPGGGVPGVLVPADEGDCTSEVSGPSGGGCGCDEEDGSGFRMGGGATITVTP